ncbi:MAG: SDR family oxidoreductase [Desulfobacteraceae bacterium]|nr:MAG: SDR family oxidoreductase [Desulfobacteraceae bacterium]
MTLQEFDLTGKVAIVTCAGRGIGKAIALCFAQTGATTVVAARTESQIEQTRKEIEEGGGKCLSISTDVTKDEDVERMASKAVDTFGKVDILVNQVGGSGGGSIVPLPGHRGFLSGGDSQASLSKLAWQHCMDTTLTSVFLCCRSVGPFMIEQKRGKIINVSSMAAAKGFANLVPYTVSKAGVAMFTRSLALEWVRYNINVNGIGPGYIPTAFTEPMLNDLKRRKKLLRSVPLGRFGEPREIGLLAVYLASPASDYLTGQTIYIDGGILA